MFPWSVLKLNPFFLYSDAYRECCQKKVCDRYTIDYQHFLSYPVTIDSQLLQNCSMTLWLYPHIFLRNIHPQRRSSSTRLSRERLSWSSKSWHLRRPRRASRVKGARYQPYTGHIAYIHMYYSIYYAYIYIYITLSLSLYIYILHEYVYYIYICGRDLWGLFRSPSHSNEWKRQFFFQQLLQWLAPQRNTELQLLRKPLGPLDAAVACIPCHCSCRTGSIFESDTSQRWFRCHVARLDLSWRSQADNIPSSNPPLMAKAACHILLKHIRSVSNSGKERANLPIWTRVVLNPGRDKMHSSSCSNFEQPRHQIQIPIGLARTDVREVPRAPPLASAANTAEAGRAIKSRPKSQQFEKQISYDKPPHYCEFSDCDLSSCFQSSACQYIVFIAIHDISCYLNGEHDVVSLPGLIYMFICLSSYGFVIYCGTFQWQTIPPWDSQDLQHHWHVVFSDPLQKFWALLYANLLSSQHSSVTVATLCQRFSYEHYSKPCCIYGTISSELHKAQAGHAPANFASPKNSNHHPDTTHFQQPAKFCQKHTRRAAQHWQQQLCNYAYGETALHVDCGGISGNFQPWSTLSKSTTKSHWLWTSYTYTVAPQLYVNVSQVSQPVFAHDEPLCFQ